MLQQELELEYGGGYQEEPGRATAARRGVPRSLAVLFFVLHAPLALLLFRSEPATTVHALVTFGVALLLTFSKEIDRVVYAAAYITGSEVLWRMCDAAVPWEFGKYAVTLIFVLRMATLSGTRWLALPIAYFALLIPSIPLTLGEYDLEGARQQISFNLSGPLLLAVSVWFLWHLKLTSKQVRTAATVLLAPVMGIAVITFYNTYTAPQVLFTLGSNSVTSGGYGPNQVSTILGLGALLSFFLAILPGPGVGYRAFMYTMVMVFVVQSAMTFSRGGLYAAAAAAVAASFYLMRDARARFGVLITTVVLVLSVNYVLLPRLDAFSGGMLSARLQRTTTSGRLEIMQGDLGVWMRNPVFGVGPGGAYGLREVEVGNVAAHTEFTRLLAEHGMLGLVAMVLLISMCFRFLGRQRNTLGRGVAAGLLVWSVVTMLHSAMRLVAPSFIFGLAAALVMVAALEPAGALRRRRPPAPLDPPPVPASGAWG